MIKILKTVKKEKGLCLIVTEIDAKAADINTEYERDVIDYRLEELLITLSDHVDNDTIIKWLKDFLVESVFTHYIDMVGILNYIYTMRNVIKVARKHPSHSKFLFTTEFKNYEGEKSDDEKKPDIDEDENPAIYDVSFKADLLKRDNLGDMEEILLSMFYTLYEGKILVLEPRRLEPRRLEISLREIETKKGTEEFVNMSVSFCKPK